MGVLSKPDKCGGTSGRWCRCGSEKFVYPEIHIDVIDSQLHR